MARIRTCAGNSFFSGKSVCEIDYDKIKYLVLTKHGVKLEYDSLADLRAQCHADLPDRAYGFPQIVNWEPNGGEVQTSQIGYGPNVYNGVSARTDALTLDKFRHYLRAEILRNVDEEFDMYLIDVKNNLYGLNDGTEVLAGIPVTIYPSGNDHPGASDKASLVVNVSYIDVEEYMIKLDVVPLNFSAGSAVYGLMPVTLEKVGSSGNNYKIIEYFGKGDATPKYGALIADNAVNVLNGVTAATYSAENEYISLTLGTGVTTPTLKLASALEARGIYGIEPYSAS